MIRFPKTCRVGDGGGGLFAAYLLQIQTAAYFRFLLVSRSFHCLCRKPRNLIWQQSRAAIHVYANLQLSLACALHGSAAQPNEILLFLLPSLTYPTHNLLRAQSTDGLDGLKNLTALTALTASS
jgi:hypothetical protein